MISARRAREADLDKAFSRMGPAQSIGGFSYIPVPMPRRQQRQALMIRYFATVVVSKRDSEILVTLPSPGRRPDMTTK
jgi:hypothetical protein